MKTIKTYIIAHRGGKGHGVENTIEAFIGAIDEGYDGVELDIQPDKNGYLVVSHDLDMKRLAGVDIKIKDESYENLHNIKLSKTESNAKGSETFNGYLLSFEDFLKLMKDNNLFMLVEIKETCEYRDVINAIELIKKYNINFDRVRIISNLNKINLLVELHKDKKYKSIKCQFVGRTDYQNYLDICRNNDIGLDLDIGKAKEKEGIQLLKEFKDNNKEINVWVVNDKESYEYLKSLGLNFITTDRKSNYEK